MFAALRPDSQLDSKLPTSLRVYLSTFYGTYRELQSILGSPRGVYLMEGLSVDGSDIVFLLGICN